MDWFQKLTGFAEVGYAQTRQRLSVVGDRLVSDASGRSHGAATRSPNAVRIDQPDVTGPPEKIFQMHVGLQQARAVQLTDLLDGLLHLVTRGIRNGTGVIQPLIQERVVTARDTLWSRQVRSLQQLVAPIFPLAVAGGGIIQK